MELKNRVVMPPMGTSLAGPDAMVSDAKHRIYQKTGARRRGTDYYRNCRGSSSGHVSPSALGGWDDKFIPGLSKLAETVHDQGGRLLCSFIIVDGKVISNLRINRR